MWRPDPSGPQGPMQVSEAAATDVGGGDRFDHVANRAIGRAYLAQLYWRYGNWPDAIAAYNWGIGKMDAWVKAGRPPDKVAGRRCGLSESRASRKRPMRRWARRQTIRTVEQKRQESPMRRRTRKSTLPAQGRTTGPHRPELAEAQLGFPKDWTRPCSWPCSARRRLDSRSCGQQQIRDAKSDIPHQKRQRDVRQHRRAERQRLIQPSSTARSISRLLLKNTRRIPNWKLIGKNMPCLVNELKSLTIGFQGLRRIVNFSDTTRIRPVVNARLHSQQICNESLDKLRLISSLACKSGRPV